ncbi:MAG: FkbM family methyltransferase [Wenzhouxiangellaceae bacterium]
MAGMRASFSRLLHRLLPARLMNLQAAIRHSLAGITHEQDLRVFAALAGLDLRIADVGAHHGEATIAMLAQAPDAAIIAFEPNPDHHLALRFLARRYRDRFRFEPVALGEHNTRSELFIPVHEHIRHDALASLRRSEFEQDHVRENVYRHSGRRQEIRFRRRTVQVRRLDDFQLSPDVIKIDVEGSEAAVLQGARQTLERCAPMLIVEFNHHDEFLPLLKSLDYRCYSWDSQRQSLMDFDFTRPALNLIALSPRTPAGIRQRLGL